MSCQNYNVMKLPEDFIKELTGYESPLLDGLEEALTLTAPSVSVRTNKGKKLSPPLCADKVSWCENGWYLTQREQFTFDVAMHQGLYYVQEASSMIISHIVSTLTKNVGRPICYLDACAAPGGKTTASIDVLPAESLVVANEYVYGRASVLAENICKWGYPSVVVSRGDTSRFRKLKAFFDIVAVDVPCSGEGMFRKDSEAVAQWSLSLIDECVARQREIIDNVWSSLRPGGYMIYSTCTYNRHENEEMIDFIINEYGAESVEVGMCVDWNIAQGINTQHHCYRFLPHRLKGEGLFIAVLRKDGEFVGKKIKPSKEKNKVASISKDVKDWVKGEDCVLKISGEQIHVIPKRWEQEMSLLCSNLEVILCGLPIAVQKGKDFVPTQNLAMSLKLNEDAFYKKDVDYLTAISYLRREAIVIDDAPRGYVLLTYKNRPLGFVKNLGNRANNLYPQEWRILSSHVPDEEPIVLKG